MGTTGQSDIIGELVSARVPRDKLFGWGTRIDSNARRESTTNR